jgi:hypothetical protein
MHDPLIDLIPMLVVQYLLLIGIIPLARRVSPRWAWAWIVVSLIPGVGAMVFMVLIMKALAAILERIDLLSRSLGTRE